MIDLLRRHAVAQEAERELAHWLRGTEQSSSSVIDDDAATSNSLDDQLAVIFACAHPAVHEHYRLPLVLNVGAGFSSPEIGRALLLSQDAASQRVVRAKRQWRELELSVQVPRGEDLSPRLATVLDCLYLMLNEGHTAHVGDALVRQDVLQECERLTTLVVQHPLTSTPTAHALLALVCFTVARTDARTDPSGALLLMHQQDRSQWNTRAILKGFAHLAQSAAGDQLTRFHLEAAIAAVHARAASFDETDWSEIVSLYDILVGVRSDAVVVLNQAVAIAMAHGTQAGLDVLDSMSEQHHATLKYYPLLFSVRGELLLRMGDVSSSITQLEHALTLTSAPREREHLMSRLQAIRASQRPH
jgi:RNA polymerase sigma-70 factor (ECF subfamily)